MGVSVQPPQCELLALHGHVVGTDAFDVEKAAPGPDFLSPVHCALAEALDERFGDGRGKHRPPPEPSSLWSMRARRSGTSAGSGGSEWGWLECQGSGVDSKGGGERGQHGSEGLGDLAPGLLNCIVMAEVGASLCAL
jgi:hypothetical protein